LTIVRQSLVLHLVACYSIKYWLTSPIYDFVHLCKLFMEKKPF
jgi:hypothetical protein